MERRERRFLMCALLATAVVLQSGSLRAAQASGATDLHGTSWLCTMHLFDGKMRKGYVYFSASMGVKIAETEHSPGTDGAWWPPVDEVSSDMTIVEPQLRWEASGGQVRIYYHPDRSMYVGGRSGDKMWIGEVALEDADPDTFFRESICQGLIISRAGSCPPLFDYLVEEPKDKFMVCEQRTGWLK